MRLTRLVVRRHCQRVQCHRLGAGEPLHQPVRPELVHQEADRAAMHAVDRHMTVEIAVQRLEHEAVAAERDDNIGVLGRARLVAPGQLCEAKLRRLGVGGDKGDRGAPRRGRAGSRLAHPPVTLMWRDTAGRLWRRSMMKSWPLGLRAIAS